MFPANDFGKLIKGEKRKEMERSGIPRIAKQEMGGWRGKCANRTCKSGKA